MKAVIATDCEVKNPQYMAWQSTDMRGSQGNRSWGSTHDIHDKSLQDVYPDKQRDWAERPIKPNEDMDPIEVILYGITS